MFFAKYDEEACWLDDLSPAFGEKEFFWESEMQKLNEWAASSTAGAGEGIGAEEVRLGSSGQHFPATFPYQNLVRAR